MYTSCILYLNVALKLDNIERKTCVFRFFLRRLRGSFRPATLRRTASHRGGLASARTDTARHRVLACGGAGSSSKGGTTRG